ncbi:MAG: DEAD/DEAH box helicase [Proteobacteria bacterium]|nr:DEAD/DEAH box helicase [Pseudomonadota bacterium]
MPFSDLGLSPEVVRAVSDAGYTIPTPIQASAIPEVLKGRDVLGCAQTGTGKTAGFTLPMIDILTQGRARARMPRSLILEPTRELATQVSENFEKYGKYHKLSMALLIGGVSYVDQEKLLDRGVDVLIATPGRLLDHFERGRILLNDVKILVIDEADRMLDMGFIPDVERIVGLLPPRRQTLFFSATMPPEIRRLADAFLKDPLEISVSPPASPAETVAQFLLPVGEDDKRDALRRLIEQEDVKNALVFCNRKKDVDILNKSLKKHGFDAAALHGDMVQSMRTETLERFKREEIRLLICSDVAARGLDIIDLSHVFNFDVPYHAEDYIHRIGRTGRAGKSGRAFTLATPIEGKAVAAIESLINKAIPRIELAGLITADLTAEDDGRRRGRGRGRGGEKRPAAERPPRRRDGGRAKPSHDAAPERAPEPVADNVVELAPAERHREAPHDAEHRPEPRAERPRDRDRGRDRGRGRHHDDEVPAAPATPMVGLGDHVPAFLLRAVKLPKTA